MQTTGTTNATLNSLISVVEKQILTPIVTLLVLAAFVLFVWGIVEYVRNAASDEKRKVGQQHMIWGLLGLVIIFGATAILHILQGIIHSLQGI